MIASKVGKNLSTSCCIVSLKKNIFPSLHTRVMSRCFCTCIRKYKEICKEYNSLPGSLRTSSRIVNLCWKFLELLKKYHIFTYIYSMLFWIFYFFYLEGKRGAIRLCLVTTHVNKYHKFCEIISVVYILLFHSFPLTHSLVLNWVK